MDGLLQDNLKNAEDNLKTFYANSKLSRYVDKNQELSLLKAVEEAQRHIDNFELQKTAFYKAKQYEKDAIEKRRLQEDIDFDKKWDYLEKQGYVIPLRG